MKFAGLDLPSEFVWGFASGVAVLVVGYLAQRVARATPSVSRVIFATDRRARMVLAATLLIGLLGFFFWRWDPDAPATVADVAEISSIVIAYWWLIARLTRLMSASERGSQ